MKRFVSLFIIMSFVVIGLFCPESAQCFEENIYIFRTLDDPSVPYDPEVLERAPFWQAEWDPLNPPPFIVPLGASIWALQTRSKNGLVVNDTVRQIGTGTAVAVVTDPGFTPFASQAPFYFEAGIGDLEFMANGYCLATSNDLPMPGIILVGCDLTVYPDAEQGILGGSATSNSIFNPYGFPGFQTGSFWTLRLYEE
jgi:hypothetical protein